MAGIIKKVTVVIRNNGTIAVNAEVFIINEKLNYLFILSTFMILFLKND